MIIVDTNVISEVWKIAPNPAVHGLAVATRDTSPFQAAGLRTINPWEEP